MRSGEMALECAKQLKEYCRAVSFCTDCIFFQPKSDELCELLEHHAPAAWRIPPDRPPEDLGHNPYQE